MIGNISAVGRLRPKIIGRVALVMSMLFSPLLFAEEAKPKIKTPDLTGEVIEYGYYVPVAEEEREPNLRSPTGYVKKVDEVKLVQQSSKIPKLKGQLFGFRFKITGFEPDVKRASFSLVVRHPEIVRPNGSRTSGYSYPVTLGVKDGVLENKSGYKFDNDFEMVDGEWRFQYWFKNKMIVEQVFQVSPPTNDEIKLIEATKTSLASEKTKKLEITPSPQPADGLDSGQSAPQKAEKSAQDS